MKKPRYKKDLFAVIFFYLGLGFILFGGLSYANIIKPTAHSQVQDSNLMGMIFSLIGLTFCLIQLALRVLSYKQAKLHNDLISEGTKLIGIIENVSIQKSIKFGGQSPYVISYSYVYEDTSFHHKSFLLWEKPNLSHGDKIDLYVNGNGQSTFEI